MPIEKNNALLPYAKQLRRDMTPWERKLWYLFLRKYPVKIYKQRIIGSYIVDFYCASAKLVIELDGSQHFEPDGLAYDAERNRYLEQCGLKVLHIPNIEIDRHFQNVCETIDAKIRSQTNVTT